MGMGNMPIIAVDKDGEFWHWVIGGLIGGAINAWTVYDDYKSGKITGKQYAAKICIGVGQGALTAAAPALAAPLAGAADFIDQTLVHGKSISEVDPISIGISTGLGQAGKYLGGKISPYISKWLKKGRWNGWVRNPRGRSKPPWYHQSRKIDGLASSSSGAVLDAANEKVVKPFLKEEIVPMLKEQFDKVYSASGIENGMLKDLAYLNYDDFNNQLDGFEIDPNEPLDIKHNVSFVGQNIMMVNIEITNGNNSVKSSYLSNNETETEGSSSDDVIVMPPKG